MDNLTFNDMPKAIELLIAKVDSLQHEIAQLRQQQAKPDENLILGKFHEWEIIYARDERLKGLLSKAAIQHWKTQGVPFHYTATGGMLYTTPRELDAYLNPHREAMKNVKI